MHPENCTCFLCKKYCKPKNITKPAREFYILDPAEDGWIEHIVHESHDYDDEIRETCEVTIGAPMIHTIEFSAVESLQQKIKKLEELLRAANEELICLHGYTTGVYIDIEKYFEEKK